MSRCSLAWPAAQVRHNAQNLDPSARIGRRFVPRPVLSWTWFNLPAAGGNTVGNALRGVPLGPERHGGRSYRSSAGGSVTLFLNHVLSWTGSQDGRCANAS